MPRSTTDVVMWTKKRKFQYSYENLHNFNFFRYEEKVTRKSTVMDHNNIVGNETGFHETWEYYDACNHRDRNGGLFVADQELKAEKAKCTRQNRNCARRGYECAEERVSVSDL